MAFFSVKELEKDQTDFVSTFERLHSSNDCILSDFLEFPHCSLETQSDNLYSSDLTFKPETDPWSNPKLGTLQSVEYRSLDDKVDHISSGSFLKCFSADSLSEESNYQDSVLPSYEMPLSDDLHSLDMNTSSLDVLDYLEDAGSTFNMTNKSTTHYNECWEQDTLFSRNECVSEMENNYENNNDSRLCFSHPASSLTINSHSWSTVDTQLELTPYTPSQSNIFHTSGTFEKKEIVENKDIYYAYNGSYCTEDWPFKDQHEKKHMPVGNFYSPITSTTFSAGEDTFAQTLTVDETIPLSNSTIFHMTATGGCKSGHIKQNMNMEELSGLQLGPKSKLNLQKQVQPGYQVKRGVPVSFRQTTVTKDQWQQPFSSDMNTDLQNRNSAYSDLKTSSKESDEMDIRNLYKLNSLTENNAHVSNTQTSKSLDTINRLANKEIKYMKVGKRGRFITMPVEKVNKLMVRDLLSMSGNREEVSIKDWTQEYRTNIRKIVQQKRKRLNIV